MDTMDTIEAASKESVLSLEEVGLQFQIDSAIAKLLVKNNMLYIILSTGLVYRIDLDEPENVGKFKIESTNKVADAYLDEMGYHLIVQTVKNEFYYLNVQSVQFKQLGKLKNLPVSSVLFLECETRTKTSTGLVLVSTLTGLVYEYLIDSNRERTFKQLWKARESITGIAGGLTSGKDYNILCQLGDTNKLLQFTSSEFTNCFKKDPLTHTFNSLMCFTSNLTSFAFLDINEDDQIYQICHGKFNFKTKNELNYLKIDQAIANRIKCILLTKYHLILLLNNNDLIIYNQLNGLETERRSFHNEPFIQFTHDDKYETYWIHSATAMWEILLNDENSDIWKIMVSKNMFDEALSLLKNPNGADSVKLDIILINKGYFMFNNGNYDKAATILATTSEPLEKVALKFLNKQKTASLRLYLITKLKSLPKSFYMQRVMLSSWIVESYIEGLNDLDNKLFVKNNSVNNTINSNGNGKLDENVQKKKEQFLNRFHKFLDEFKDILDKETVYQIISAHNRTDELLYYSNLIRDYEFVLKYYLNLQKWDEALKVLCIQRKPELVYQCSTALLVNYSIETITTWKRLIDDLEYEKLLPALLTYNKTVCKARDIKPEFNQAIQFLQFLIKEKQVKDKIIHNTLLSILITYPNLENENLIIKYLENQLRSRNLFGNSSDYEILFDHDFILRLCFKFKKIQSAIFIYSMLGNYEEAVKLALDNDLIEVAVFVAGKPLESSTLRKKLWLNISKKLIRKVIMNDKFLEQHQKLLELNLSGENMNPEELKEISTDDKISKLLTFLMNKCELLTVKDLLPLFPDFIVIDNFKEEIVKSLESMSLEMHRLSNEMESSITQSKKINKQIDNFKLMNFQIISPTESCVICNKILTIRKFIIFPCYHSFHQDCLVRMILNSNDYKFKNSVYKLQKKIMLNKGNKDIINELKSEIDELLSTKCALCTDIKINDIEEPLVKAGDREQDDWEL